MTQKWTRSQIIVVCYMYKTYKNQYSIQLLSYLIEFKLKRLALSFLNKSCKFPNISSIKCMLYRCQYLDNNIHKKYISKLQYLIWNSHIDLNQLFIDDKLMKLWNEPIYSECFRLFNHTDLSVKVLGPGYVNNLPLDIENYKLFQYVFEMLPYIVDKNDLYSYTKKSRKIEFIELYNPDKSPKIIDTYTFDILPINSYDKNSFIISNLQKKNKYDSIKTYCQYYMDSIIQAASQKCADLDENLQDNFVDYFNYIKEEIEHDNTSNISNNDILTFLEILKPNNILQYYNPIQ